MTFDLTDPSKPRFIERCRLPSSRFGYWPDNNNDVDVDAFTIALPQIPELSPRERLALATAHWFSFDGETWCRADERRVATYHLEELGPDAARFRKTGRYDVTPVQRLFGVYPRNLVAARGFLYESSESGRVSDAARLIVYDVRDPQRPHPTGHFALPHVHGDFLSRPLDDGRILAGDYGHLYLLGPPPRQD